ncbi:uncharacterized protein LOC131596804 [Vicia villosa]|uniref:uncharacterized protein LOC131596804 n=1 Tax=Vicia villosa TaxID=3911 RepID=UPI00273C6B6E|nr:uncharacterized protein LOC131596804 [Vicia villosa]
MCEEENTQQNGSKQTEGASKKRTRGPTKCLKIHARKSADREEVVLDDNGEPIGPNDRTVTDLSCFLGTVARNSDLCPLVYTNFKALKKANKDRIWEFVTDKFIIPENGSRAVFSRINDAWRRLGKISKINVVNRAKQKYMHRMGPTNFARIRAKLKEDGKEVSQAEMFIETRQSRKGKQPDEETSSVISKLQELVQDSTESETFNSLFGKEKSGQVRCYGRTITPTMLKIKEEILVIKRQHNDEVAGMKREMDGMKALFKTMMKQQNPHMSDEEISNLMASAMGCSISSTAAPADPHSYASTHIPRCEQLIVLLVGTSFVNASNIDAKTIEGYLTRIVKSWLVQVDSVGSYDSDVIHFLFDSVVAYSVIVSNTGYFSSSNIDHVSNIDHGNAECWMFIVFIGGEEADCDEDMEEGCDDIEDVEEGCDEDVEEAGYAKDLEEEQGEDQEE